MNDSELNLRTRPLPRLGAVLSAPHLTLGIIPFIYYQKSCESILAARIKYIRRHGPPIPINKIYP